MCVIRNHRLYVRNRAPPRASIITFLCNRRNCATWIINRFNDNYMLPGKLCSVITTCMALFFEPAQSPMTYFWLTTRDVKYFLDTDISMYWTYLNLVRHLFLHYYYQIYFMVPLWFIPQCHDTHLLWGTCEKL